MSRRFREHQRRSVTSLDGIWDFAFLGDTDPDNVDTGAVHFSDRMAVPGCFDATPAYAGRRGLVAYRTRVPLQDATPHRLVFDGANHWCRVYLDGTPLDGHVGGFTRFHADITGHPAGEAELVVLVDNRLDPARCPLHLEYFDWYQYGGLTRSVTLHRLSELWIDACRVVTENIEPPVIKLILQYGVTRPLGTTRLRITLDGRTVVEESVALTGESGSLERSLEVPGAQLWSPEAPNLHTLHLQLGKDDLHQRIGIRQVRVAGQQILINDKPARLLGFCRHEAHLQFGHALPDQLLVADVQQLRDMGCNFVRGSHYPQDPRFLDLCDAAGICVWNEAIGWQHTPAHLTDPHFIGAQRAHIDEMVAMSCNHPSVIMWGILNESHSHDARCRPGYEALLSRLRELDPTRPVTYACNHPFDDVCLDLVDVVSVNCYPGWYHGAIADIPGYLDEIAAHLDANGQADKPMIISEIGAGAIPGWRDGHESRWTEQYQARLLDQVCKHVFVDRGRFAGLSIWQFCDCRTTELASRMLGRPRGFNNKGVVDEYRRPKLAYETVKRHFLALGGEQQQSEHP